MVRKKVTPGPSYIVPDHRLSLFFQLFPELATRLLFKLCEFRSERDALEKE